MSELNQELWRKQGANFAYANKSTTTPEITINIGGIQIGRIQSFNETQSQGSNQIYEIGTRGIKEIVAGQPTYSLEVNKVKIHSYNLLQVLSDAGQEEKYNAEYSALVTYLEANQINAKGIFANIKHIALPFDIVLKEKKPSYSYLENHEEISTTTYIDCVITNYTRPHSASGDLIITETASIQCKDIKYS